MNAKFLKAVRRFIRQFDSLTPATSYIMPNTKNPSAPMFGSIVLNPKCRRGAYQKAKRVAKVERKNNSVNGKRF